MQERFYVHSVPNYPRDSVRVLTRHRTVHITQNTTSQRVLPTPPVPTQMNGSLSTEEGRSIVDDKSTWDQGRGVVVDELGYDLAQLDDLNVVWECDLDAFLRERTQHVSATGDADDGIHETMCPSEWGAVDTPWTLAGRADNDSTVA